MGKCRIEKDLEHLARPIEDLLLDERQAREHNRRSIEAIKASLEAHGQKKPVVVDRKTMQVKAGNGTLMAAKELGWSRLAAVLSDDDEHGLREYALRDNRTGELSAWDIPALLDELSDLSALDLGWTRTEIADLGDSLFAESLFADVETTEREVKPPIKREAVISLMLLVKDAEIIERAIDAEVDLFGGTRGEALARICSGQKEDPKQVEDQGDQAKAGRRRARK